MFALLAGLALKVGVPQRFAKAVGIFAAIIFLIGALAGLKACYDHSIIANHDARQDAANTKADRKADENAATRRRADDTRLNAEATALKEATKNAQTPHDRRVARQRCIRLQQAARAAGREPPSCG